jgi:SAM-dependent methyltransferase
VKRSEAVELIRDAVGDTRGVWADLGAGNGTFTRALIELLGPDSRIYAVDRDPEALAALNEIAAAAPNVVVVRGDFTTRLQLPGLASEMLDGVLLANTLHFAREADGVLSRIAQRVRDGGRIVVVEYDRRSASQWVPYPVPIERLMELAKAAGLTEPVVTATQPSRYQGVLYAAVAARGTRSVTER